MHWTLEGGTDAGSMVIFDPAALPSDFDKRKHENPFDLLEQLTQAGLLYWLNTASDGGYTLGVYLSHELPQHVKPYAQRLDTCREFHVPSGRLYFTGVEYAFQEDDSFLRKYPGMGEAAEIRPGRYWADLFEFEYPEDFYEDLLRQRLPADQFRLHNLMNTLAPIGCVTPLAAFGLLALLKWAGLHWTVWAVTVLPVGLILIALPIYLSRLPGYREADAVSRALDKEFPAYGILLRKPAPTESRS